MSVQCVPVDHVLCFFSCVCKQCRPPALIFYIALDEKQNIKLLWPKKIDRLKNIFRCIYITNF